MSKESKKALNDAVQELEAARDAARLKAHLFSMDAKRTFQDLESKAKELQRTISSQGEKMAENSAATARDLARSIRKFVEKHV